VNWLAFLSDGSAHDIGYAPDYETALHVAGETFGAALVDVGEQPTSSVTVTALDPYRGLLYVGAALAFLFMFQGGGRKRGK
jgi:hypothetical protein